jgi:hypothetical protein
MKNQFVKFMSYSLILALPLFALNSCSTDPCETVTCGANGVATEDGDNCTCVCETGYEGNSCETEVRSKFVANYRWTDSCSPGENYTSSITASATDVKNVNITNILGELEGSANGTVTKNGDDYVLNIPTQQVTDIDGDVWSVSSTGAATLTATGTSFSITIQSTFGVNTITCTHTYNKQ